MTKMRGAKRCPYCKNNTVINGVCNVCNPKERQIPFLTEEEINLNMTAGIMIISSVKNRRKKERGDK